MSGQNSEYAVWTNTHKVLRQDDALACLLFNIALDRAIRVAGITRNIRGTIVYKSVQMILTSQEGHKRRRIKSLSVWRELLKRCRGENKIYASNYEGLFRRPILNRNWFI
jgi:hypothetical protein